MNAGADSLKIRDVEALQKLETITDVAPMVFLSGTASYGKEEANPRIIGTTPAGYTSRNMEIAQGRFHDETDEGGTRPVAVIGPDVVKDLFANNDPIGKRIEVGTNRYLVIGVFKPMGSQFFQNMDDLIIVPFSTAKSLLARDYVDMVSAQATGDTDDAISDIEHTLRRRHNITPPVTGKVTDNDDFLVRSAGQLQEIMGTVTLALTLFISLIAAVSLVVGGIGIMNIMLVSVTERTREIGLRKALGARERDIMMQFLIDAVSLTFLGGLVGLFCGLWLNLLIAVIVQKYLADFAFILSPTGIVLSLLMAGATGLIFGIVPARRAAALNPIDALRYE
jgi:putative ABC transport system permease protein